VPFFLPRSRTGEGGRGGLGPAAGGGIQGPAAAGDRGKRKRGERACYSRAHLGRGWLEEVPPRQGAAGGGGWWRRRKWWCGGAIGCHWKLAAGVRSGEEGCRPFIGRVGRFGGGDFLAGRSPAGSAGAGRVQSPGDGTARAGAEVVKQPMGHAAQEDGTDRPGARR
jgi:hypothetical protein